MQDNSPGQKAGLEAFFDFIITIAGKRLDQDNDMLKEILKQNIDKPVRMTVYSSKTQNVREVLMTPGNGWGGHGLLGVSVRFCSFEGVNENVWHILEVHPHSPAEIAGLRAYSDYVIGADVRNENDDLFTMIQTHEQQPLRIFVYNIDDDACREVVIKPNSNWGGEGALGCGIGYGYLHRIPVQAGNMINSSVSAVPHSFGTSTNNSISNETNEVVSGGSSSANILTTATTANVASPSPIVPSLPYVPPLSNTFVTNTVVNNANVTNQLLQKTEQQSQSLQHDNGRIAPPTTQSVFKTYFNPDIVPKHTPENTTNHPYSIPMIASESVKKSMPITAGSIAPPSTMHIPHLFESATRSMIPPPPSTPVLSVSTDTPSPPTIPPTCTSNNVPIMMVGAMSGSVPASNTVNTNTVHPPDVTANVSNIINVQAPVPVPMFATGGPLQYMSSPVASLTYPAAATVHTYPQEPSEVNLMMHAATTNNTVIPTANRPLNELNQQSPVINLPPLQPPPIQDGSSQQVQVSTPLSPMASTNANDPLNSSQPTGIDTSTFNTSTTTTVSSPSN